METFYLQALMHICSSTAIFMFTLSLVIQVFEGFPWRISLFIPMEDFSGAPWDLKGEIIMKSSSIKLPFTQNCAVNWKIHSWNLSVLAVIFFSFYAISNFIEDNLIISPSRSRGAPDRPDGQFSPFNIFWINENGLNPMIICIFNKSIYIIKL